MKFLKNFFKKKEKVEEVEYDYSETLWYVHGLNNNEPILKIDQITDGYVSAHFIDEGNKGKKHYQELNQFRQCFSFAGKSE